MSSAAAACFYRTRRGTAAAKLLADAVDAFWGGCRGLRVGVLGPAGSVLRPLAPDAERVVLLHAGVAGPVPAQLQVGVTPEALPVADNIFDRVLLLHSLERSEDRTSLLREVWRMTAPEGRVLIAVPNWFGPWAWSGASPFRHGRALTAAGLRRCLGAAAFEPLAVRGALRAPPLPETAYLRVAALCERRAWPLPGVILAEGRKRLHVPTPIQSERVARRLRLALTPGSTADRGGTGQTLLGGSTGSPSRVSGPAAEASRRGRPHAPPPP